MAVALLDWDLGQGGEGPRSARGGRLWHFDRVGTYPNNSPIFVIRATHRGVGSNGEYTDCLDVPNSNVCSGQPIQTWHCNGGAAQKWIQIHLGGELFSYAPLLDRDWILQFNNGDAFPHLVLVPIEGPSSLYVYVEQDYCCP